MIWSAQNLGQLGSSTCLAPVWFLGFWHLSSCEDLVHTCTLARSSFYVSALSGTDSFSHSPLLLSIPCSQFLSGSSIHLSSHDDSCPSAFLPSWLTFQNQGALYIWKTNFFYWINSSKLPWSTLTARAGAGERDMNVERAWKASITNFLPFYGHSTQSHNFKLL